MMPPRIVLFLLLGQIFISASVHATDKKASTKSCSSTCKHKQTTVVHVESTTEIPLVDPTTTPATEVEIPVPEKNNCVSKLAKRLKDLCNHVNDRLDYLEDMMKENNKKLDNLSQGKCCMGKSVEYDFDDIIPDDSSQNHQPVTEYNQDYQYEQEEQNQGQHQQQLYPEYSYEIYDQLESEAQEKLQPNPRLKVIRPLSTANQGPYDIYT